MKKALVTKITEAITAYASASNGLDTFINKRSKEKVQDELKAYRADVLKPIAKEQDCTMAETQEYVDYKRWESAILMRFIRAEKKVVAKKAKKAEPTKETAASDDNGVLETTEETTQENLVTSLQNVVTRLVTAHGYGEKELTSLITRTVKQAEETAKLEK